MSHPVWLNKWLSHLPEALLDSLQCIVCLLTSCCICLPRKPWISMQYLCTIKSGLVMLLEEEEGVWQRTWQKEKGAGRLGQTPAVSLPTTIKATPDYGHQTQYLSITRHTTQAVSSRIKYTSCKQQGIACFAVEDQSLPTQNSCDSSLQTSNSQSKPFPEYALPESHCSSLMK